MGRLTGDRKAIADHFREVNPFPFSPIYRRAAARRVALPPLASRHPGNPGSCQKIPNEKGWLSKGVSVVLQDFRHFDCPDHSGQAKA